MNDDEKYLAEQEASGIKVGDLVRVARKAFAAEGGWNCIWTDTMNQNVGRVGVVIKEDNHCPSSGFLVDIDEDPWWYPYFVLEHVFGEPMGTTDTSHGEPIPPTERLIEMLYTRYPYGHKDFIPMILDEIKLHSNKNHDYAFGGPATGNFDRVSTIKKLYPGLDWTTPAATAIDYMLKQLDAALWLLAGGYRAVVEGTDERWRDVSVYAKIIRLLLMEGAKHDETDNKINTVG